MYNYGREYREGHHLDSADGVDGRPAGGLADGERSSISAGLRRGAQMVLHARCALINGELGKYTGWSPSDSSLEQAVRGMKTPRFFPVPI